MFNVIVVLKWYLLKIFTQTMYYLKYSTLNKIVAIVLHDTLYFIGDYHNRLQ